MSYPLPLRATVAFLGCAFLFGCTNESHYQMLLPRPYELRDGAEVRRPVPPPSAPIAISPEDEQKIAILVVQADEGQAAFATLDAKLHHGLEVAQHAAVNSEAWVNAQVSISALEAARGPTLAARSALDALFTQIRDAGADVSSLVVAQDHVATLVGIQGKILSHYQDNLSQTGTTKH